MSYDPTIGRWTTQDPIAFRGGDPNLYRYAGNDPTDRTDPSGLFTISVGLGGEAYLGFIHIPVQIDFHFGYSPSKGITVGPVITTGYQHAVGLGVSGGVSGGFTTASGVGDLGGNSTNLGVSTPFGGAELTAAQTYVGASGNTLPGLATPIAGIHLGDVKSWAWEF
jgi:hypothetical protein